MIGSLHGIVELKDSPFLLIAVHGVGYRVQVPSTILSNALIDTELKLYTYTHVREDTLELFGFATLPDLKLFERLLSVSGIGPRTAMNVFAIGTRSAIIEAILKSDVAFFTAVPRLGKKNAQKLIIELRGKFEGGESIDGLPGEEGEDDVIEALKHFGFSPQEARIALQHIGGKGETIEKKVKLALQYLGK